MQIFTKTIDVLDKLSARGLSARLNLHIGHLVISESRELKFVDVKHVSHDEVSKTYVSKPLSKLSGSLSQKSLNVNSQRQLRELSKLSKMHLENNQSLNQSKMSDSYRRKQIKLDGLVSKPRRSIFDTNMTPC